MLTTTSKIKTKLKAYVLHFWSIAVNFFLHYTVSYSFTLWSWFRKSSTRWVKVRCSQTDLQSPPPFLLHHSVWSPWNGFGATIWFHTLKPQVLKLDWFTQQPIVFETCRHTMSLLNLNKYDRSLAKYGEGLMRLFSSCGGFLIESRWSPFQRETSNDKHDDLVHQSEVE